MATFVLTKLSGGTNGRNIKVAATATLGTTIHTAHATALDLIHLECCNTDTVARKLTLEWGGATSPDDLWEQTIPAESGPVLLTPPAGRLLTGSLVVTAFAETANVIVINGHVNRVS